MPKRPPLRAALAAAAVLVSVAAGLIGLEPARAGAQPTVTFVNRSAETIWIGSGVSDNPVDSSAAITGLPVLAPGETSAPVVIPTDSPAGHWRGRFFARQRCAGEPGSTFRCVAGDCGNLADRCLTAPSPVSLAEFNFDPKDAWAPWYNVSYVDGVNLPVTIAPDGVPPATQGACATMGCATPMFTAGDCPGALSADGLVCAQRTVAERDDGTTPYATEIKKRCPSAYSWSRDGEATNSSPVVNCIGCSGFTVTFHANA
ncbi:thaumatin family protein [Spirilliplanes yamanashiensis]|uniref:Thaumatin pathogenesis-like protein n=1 Tax=Spirilliplanes yamanashiensis TaxID=42233 RepID=A0A8J3Y874_9ACTN|nr:thaumatin family protein [Spirilliplanes yamanashiensis]MDP9817270.1 hypothetical protein [Spirilliplanes yamanashiensis]GIJ03077.1 hypothetical protein Sya03_24290 [Spirilliplanes yamanashiensis]